MAKGVKAKFALSTKEIQRFKDQDIEMLDDLQLWDVFRKEIKGLKSKLEDSYFACGNDSDELYQFLIGMKDTAIDILAKIRHLLMKAQESRESLKLNSNSIDYSKSGVSVLSSFRLPGCAP
ncbi:hypothetical protein AVEN_227062-1 [Araneus ventricosus]|uniref:Uncharacterized protein n=1 Tax=Araneus ventricosus TaxID=182803 RepID=A0A4Y2L9L0_ARAVE|nr:hypothetical protein AVEN_227062-1 [Araneus ventricosus]